MTDTAIAIDGHVHLRDPERDADALVAAARNFARWSPLPSRIGVLMLAEGPGEDAFARLRDRGIAAATAEPESLWAAVDGWRLLILAGQQLNTAEGLEVLALATVRRLDDGLPLNELLDAVTARGAVAVLPWGCGKWLGARRRHVEAAVQSRAARPLLLGDNGNRPRAWHEPLLRSGPPVLRGTDPLPLPGQWRRVGRFGSSLAVMPSTDRPAADLRQALRDPQVALRPFGPHERPGRFLLEQTRLQLAQRLLAGGRG